MQKDYSPNRITLFQSKVYKAVRAIKKGRVKTYKEIAEAIGRPGAWRAVGNALNKNRDPLVPCHRVVRSDGSPGGYNQGPRKKKALLISEGALSQ
ncbi:MAG: MGMT family protein [Candidatus Wildermuthbacteria bacterium]|nr:MGMT family protein [Candidatus Wildermuthbacteria bacterium]